MTKRGIINSITVSGGGPNTTGRVVDDGREENIFSTFLTVDPLTEEQIPLVRAHLEKILYDGTGSQHTSGAKIQWEQGVEHNYGDEAVLSGVNFEALWGLADANAPVITIRANDYDRGLGYKEIMAIESLTPREPTEMTFNKRK